MPLLLQLPVKVLVAQAREWLWLFGCKCTLYRVRVYARLCDCTECECAPRVLVLYALLSESVRLLPDYCPKMIRVEPPLGSLAPPLSLSFSHDAREFISCALLTQSSVAGTGEGSGAKVR